MRGLFISISLLLNILSNSAFSSPFFSQRVPNPSVEDASMSSALIYDWFGRPVVQRVADNFTVSSSKTIRSVSWWGKFKDNNAPNSIDFNIKIFGDKNGRPDNQNILNSTNVNYSKLEDTGENFGGKWSGDNIYVFRANITPTVIEAGKQFWFSVAGDSGEQYGQFGWRLKDVSRGISFYDVPDYKGDFNNMIFSWKYQQSSNFSFVLDDEFITGLPLPDNISTRTDIISISNRTRPFSITFKSETDSLYKVEVSENLRQWSTIKEIRADNSEGIVTTLIKEDSNCEVLVPSETNGGSTLTVSEWTNSSNPPNSENWTSGTQGVGIERSPSGTYDSNIGVDVEEEMYRINPTVYIRVPFNITQEQIESFTQLTLRVKYDDSFVAYLNGEEVTRDAERSPADLTWNSRATSTHSDSLALTFIEFDITPFIGSLKAGENMLALHGLNAGQNSSDALWRYELIATSRKDTTTFTDTRKAIFKKQYYRIKKSG